MKLEKNAIFYFLCAIITGMVFLYDYYIMTYVITLILFLMGLIMWVIEE